jgi:hypothetical protein
MTTAGELCDMMEEWMSKGNELNTVEDKKKFCEVMFKEGKLDFVGFTKAKNSTELANQFNQVGYKVLNITPKT